MVKRLSLRGVGKDLLSSADGDAPHPVQLMRTRPDTGQVIHVPLEVIEPNPDQPRKHFDPDALRGLTESIQTKGVLQPILIRPILDSDRYMVIAGDRRFRAARTAGLLTIPAIIHQKDDPDELAMIENVQRENLTAIDEAEGLARLKLTRGYTTDRLAHVIGKSTRSVEESISLTNLPSTIRNEARTFAEVKKTQLLQVLRAPNSDAKLALWERIKTGQMTVREAKNTNARTSTSKPGPKPFVHTFRADDKTFTVTVKFRKAIADPPEVVAALQAALNHLT